jgi:hypothetical protein
VNAPSLSLSLSLLPDRVGVFFAEIGLLEALISGGSIGCDMLVVDLFV